MYTNEMTVEEYVQGMKEYAEKIKKQDPEITKKSLIRIGVLNADGTPKKQICNGDYCVR